MFLPRALVVLKLLELRGTVRRFARQAKRPAGVLFILAYGLMFAPSLMQRAFREPMEFDIAQPIFVGFASAIIGLATLGTLLAPESRFTMNFRPAEVDFLFTGPYSRRQVLTYKLLSNVTGSLFVGVIAALASFAFSPSPGAVFAGAFLSMIFVSQISTAYTMLVQVLSNRVKYAGYALAAAIVAAIAYAMLSISRDLGPRLASYTDMNVLYNDVFVHPVVWALTLPVSPFANTVAGVTEPWGWWAWVGISVAVNAILYGCIVLLDADYMESAIVRSARMYTQLERFKRGQLVSTRSITGERTRSLPTLPRLGGFGPTAWRQLTGAMRSWGRSIVIAYVIAIAGGIFVRRYDVEESIVDFALPVLLGVLIYISIIAVNLLRFDFRSDLDVMDNLKTLPASSASIAAGQLVAPSLILSLVYMAFAIGTGIAVYRMDIPIIIGALMFPFSALLVGIENVAFLLWPIRMAFHTNADISMMGRGFLVFALKGLIILPACGIAAGAGVAVGFFSSSWMLGSLVAAVVMAAEAAATIPAMAAAFDRFDVSRDTPP